MNLAWRRIVTVSVTMSGIAPEDTDLSSIPCPICARELCVHQPEEAVPYRLLGVCQECRHWLVIQFDLDGSLLMVELPEFSRPSHDGPKSRA